MAKAGFSLVSALGGRAAHRVVSRSFGQPFFDHLEPGGFSRKSLEDSMESSRYYAWANLIRGALYVPVAIGLAGTGHWFSLTLIVALVSFHALSVWAELYRFGSTRQLLAAGSYGPEPPSQPVAELDPAPHWYFSPKRWESENFYRILGFEIVRKLVNFYIDHTQLTRSERAAGKRAQQMAPTRAGVLQYEATTRQAETMHWLAASFNVPPFVSFLLLGKARLAGWVGGILFIDLALVLLQRYHRVRVMGRWKRMLAKRREGAAS